MTTQISLLQQLKNRLQRNEPNNVVNVSETSHTFGTNYVSETNYVQTQDPTIRQTLGDQISQAYQKNQNLIKFVVCFLVFLMYPLLIFFPIFYYLVRHFTNDTKYISILVLMFTVLVTNGILGTLYIVLVLLALTLMWNYDNIYFILDLFTPDINNKVKSITTLSNIYVNKSMQNKFVATASDKLFQILNSVNNDKNSKLGQAVAYCELASNWVFVLVDFILEKIVAHIIILLTESIESVTQKLLQKHIQNTNTVETNNNVYQYSNSQDLNNVIPTYRENTGIFRRLPPRTSSPSYTPPHTYSPTSSYHVDNDLSNVIPTYSSYNSDKNLSPNSSVKNFNLISSENIDDIFRNSDPAISASYKQALADDLARDQSQEYSNINTYNSNFLNNIDNEYTAANNMLSKLNKYE